jgi:hypothetical protein
MQFVSAKGIQHQNTFAHQPCMWANTYGEHDRPEAPSHLNIHTQQVAVRLQLDRLQSRG